MPTAIPTMKASATAAPLAGTKSDKKLSQSQAGVPALMVERKSARWSTCYGEVGGGSDQNGVCENFLQRQSLLESAC